MMNANYMMIKQPKTHMISWNTPMPLSTGWVSETTIARKMRAMYV